MSATIIFKPHNYGAVPSDDISGVTVTSDDVTRTAEADVTINESTATDGVERVYLGRISTPLVRTSPDGTPLDETYMSIRSFSIRGNEQANLDYVEVSGISTRQYDLYYTGPFDYEGWDKSPIEIELHIRFYDVSGKQKFYLSVEIGDVDEYPTSIGLSTNTFAVEPETVGEATTTARYLADITREEDDGIVSRVELSAGNTYFEIRDSFDAEGNFDGQELWLKGGIQLDYESMSSISGQIVVTEVQGGGQKPTPIDFTLEITDIDEYPTSIALSTNTFDEEPETVGSGTTTARYLADITREGDDGIVSRVELSAGDTYFEIRDITTGGSLERQELWLKGGIQLDYESMSSISGQIVVTEVQGGGQKPTPIDFTLEITDIDEYPTSIALSTNTFDEEPETVGSATTTARELADITREGDDGIVSRVELSSGNTYFEIRDITTGGSLERQELWLKGGIQLDYESMSSISGRIVVTEIQGGGQKPTPIDFTLEITDVDEYPTSIALSTGNSLTKPETVGSKTTDGSELADITRIGDDGIVSRVELSAGDTYFEIKDSFDAEGNFDGQELWLREGIELDYEGLIESGTNVIAGQIDIVEVQGAGQKPTSINFTLTVEDADDPSALNLKDWRGVEISGLTAGLPPTIADSDPTKRPYETDGSSYDVIFEYDLEISATAAKNRLVIDIDIEDVDSDEPTDIYNYILDGHNIPFKFLNEEEGTIGVSKPLTAGDDYVFHVETIIEYEDSMGDFVENIIYSKFSIDIVAPPSSPTLEYRVRDGMILTVDESQLNDSIYFDNLPQTSGPNGSYTSTFKGEFRWHQDDDYNWENGTSTSSRSFTFDLAALDFFAGNTPAPMEITVERIFNPGTSENDLMLLTEYDSSVSGVGKVVIAADEIGKGRKAHTGGEGNDVFVLYQGEHATGEINLDIVMDFNRKHSAEADAERDVDRILVDTFGDNWGTYYVNPTTTNKLETFLGTLGITWAKGNYDGATATATTNNPSDTIIYKDNTPVMVLKGYTEDLTKRDFLFTNSKPETAYDLPDAYNLTGVTSNQGFKLVDETGSGDNSRSVGILGDVNDDGIIDFIVGASKTDSGELTDNGAAYVVFGDLNGYPSTINLGSLDGTNGFRIYGKAAGDELGIEGSFIGDINHDGIDDFAVGVHNADNNGSDSGSVYFIYGQKNKADGTSGFALTSGEFNLDSITNTSGSSKGFRVDGVVERGNAEYPYFLGDVNGDGVDDALVMVPNAVRGGYDKPTSYIILGKNVGGSDENETDFSATIDLGTPDAGIIPVKGDTTRRDASGVTAASIGDLNEDGYDDFIVGARYDNKNAYKSGTAYVVFGDTAIGTPSKTEINLKNLNGSDGFAIHGVEKWDEFGSSVAGISDFNGDDIPDIIASAFDADNNGRHDSGSVYVIFGKGAGSYQASYEISQLNQGGANLRGIRIDGVLGEIVEDPETEEIEARKGDYLGTSVWSAGDFDGDGYGDVLAGTRYNGKFHLIFGGNNLQGPIDLAGTSNGRWIEFNGVETDYSWHGRKVSAAGDLNDDGLSDIILGSSGNDSYVIYGQAREISLSLKNNTLEVSAAGGDNVQYFWKTYEDTDGNDIDDVTKVVATTTETERTYTPTESATMRVQAVFTDYNGEIASLQTEAFSFTVDDDTGAITPDIV